LIDAKAKKTTRLHDANDDIRVPEKKQSIRVNATLNSQ
jgi:hypothetical protein